MLNNNIFNTINEGNYGDIGSELTCFRRTTSIDLIQRNVTIVATNMDGSATSKLMEHLIAALFSRNKIK